MKREDPAEYSVVTHPYQYSRSVKTAVVSASNANEVFNICRVRSLTQRSFQGASRRESKWERSEGVGRKELTGFSENNVPIVEPSGRDTARFSTHYQSRSDVIGSHRHKLTAPN